MAKLTLGELRGMFGDAMPMSAALLKAGVKQARSDHRLPYNEHEDLDEFIARAAISIVVKECAKVAERWPISREEALAANDLTCVVRREQRLAAAIRSLDSREW